MSTYLLAIDAGTGSCRAVLFDRLGHQVAAAHREWVHPQTPGVPGGQDFDVERNWQLICQCTREVLMRSGVTGREVAAVSTTSMREGIVVFDAGLRELWACPNVDSRAATEAAELVDSGAADEFFETGGDWVSITSPARLLWLQRHRPDVLDNAASIGMLGDWITTRLTAVSGTEPSCGSSSGLFDLAARDWSQRLAALCGLAPNVLPPVREPGTQVGVVTTTAADATGLAAGTPVAAGGADTQLGLVGAGICRDQLAIIAGTFWQTTTLVERPLIDPDKRLRTLCHSVPGQWMLEGIGFYSGMSMRWLRDAFFSPEVVAAAAHDEDPYAVMERLAAGIPPGSRGVLAILSNVMDSRRWIHASPSFLQFDVGDPSSGKAACVRAVEEAAAYVARAHAEIIGELTDQTFTTATFTGGASKGRLWPQIIADVLGVPVEVPTITESSALGAAMAAGVAVGAFASLDDRPDARSRTTVIDPTESHLAVYDELYASWRGVYRRMLDLSEDGLLRPMWRSPGVATST